MCFLYASSVLFFVHSVYYCSCIVCIVLCEFSAYIQCLFVHSVFICTFSVYLYIQCLFVHSMFFWCIQHLCIQCFTSMCIQCVILCAFNIKIFCAIGVVYSTPRCGECVHVCVSTSTPSLVPCYTMEGCNEKTL